MQKFSAPDYLTITYRDDLRMLVTRWLRPTSSAEIREGYQVVLEAGLHFKCPYWLLDGRRRLPVDSETTNWGLFEFFPQLSPQMGQRVYLSQLLSPSYQQVTESMPAFQQLESTPQTFQMRRFNDEAQAVDWLRECQRYVLQPSH
ncbi:hypothetical protein [uncultured Hymenobacter sp.]|uniref:hypothetical protein n=1 Tax=uncultured Hymenobacter sp. TaxID=170016 RepID=UPI0035C9E96E